MEIDGWKRYFRGETDRTRQVHDVECKCLQEVEEVSRLRGGWCHNQKRGH